MPGLWQPRRAQAAVGAAAEPGRRGAGEEARRIHYEEAPKRSIRGLASRDEAASLAEEGIEVMPLPFGNLLKNPVQ